jgi:hypothetical protein
LREVQVDPQLILKFQQTAVTRPQDGGGFPSMLRTMSWNFTIC